MIFFRFFEHVKKSMIFERPAAEAQTPGFPSGKVGTLRGGFLTTPTAGQGLARRISEGYAPAAGPSRDPPDLRACGPLMVKS